MVIACLLAADMISDGLFHLAQEVALAARRIGSADHRRAGRERNRR
jgi:hypothetical protein